MYIFLNNDILLFSLIQGEFPCKFKEKEFSVYALLTRSISKEASKDIFDIWRKQSLLQRRTNSCMSSTWSPHWVVPELFRGFSSSRFSRTPHSKFWFTNITTPFMEVFILKKMYCNITANHADTDQQENELSQTANAIKKTQMERVNFLTQVINL